MQQSSISYRSNRYNNTSSDSRIHHPQVSAFSSVPQISSQVQPPLTTSTIINNRNLYTAASYLNNTQAQAHRSSTTRLLNEKPPILPDTTIPSSTMLQQQQI